MDAKKCDLCGKLYEIYSSTNGQKWNNINLMNDNYKIQKIDVCPICNQAFVKFINSRKENK